MSTVPPSPSPHEHEASQHFSEAMRDASLAGECFGIPTLRPSPHEETTTDEPLHLGISESGVVATAFETLNAGVVVFDTAGRVIRMNAAGKALAARWAVDGAMDMDNEHASQMFAIYDENGSKLPPEQWPSVRILAGEDVTGSRSLQCLFHTLDGGELWVDIAGTALRAPDGRVVGAVCIFSDVTERRQQEQQQSMRAGKLAATFEAIADAVLVFDAEGRATDINTAGRELISRYTEVSTYQLDHATRATRLEMWNEHGEPLRLNDRPIDRLTRGEALVRGQAVEVTVRAKDGSDLHLSISGAPIRDSDGKMTGSVCVLRDVTDRKRLERELKERASQLETIFDTLTDGILVFDAEGNILRTNGAVGAMLCMATMPEYETLPICERLQIVQPRDEHGGPLDDTHWPPGRVLRGETLVGDSAVDEWLRTFDGRDVMVNVTGAPLRDADGKITGAVVLMRDVTSHRKLVQQKDEFLRVASHELKTPLVSVKTLSQFLLRDLERSGSPDVAHLSQLMHRSLDRMERLISDLLDVGRIDAGKLRLRLAECDLGVLCRQVTDEFSTYAPGRLLLAVPDTPVRIRGDSDRLAQVLLNLLTNALKYAPVETPIAITLSVQDVSAVVSVTDRGPGIPAEALPHLFDRFFQAPGVTVQSGSAMGLGLGLYISREILTQHGGRIWAESAPGVGSTFHYALPLLQAGAASSGASGRDEEPPQGASFPM